MNFGHDVNTARGIAESTLKLMATHGVPSEPANFTVWYSYVAGENGELSKAIDALIAGEEKFTPDRNTELYEKFFGVSAESEALQEASGRIENAITKVLKILSVTEKETSRYGAALETYSGQLDQPLQLEEVREIVNSIASETRRMIERQKELDKELVRSGKEISELRQNLENVQREALTDPLTGIANRKEFDARLREMSREAKENGTPLSLLLLDIDFFKAFNDSFGHAVGDQVLRLVAKTMIDSIKGRDLAARLGGEEFAILLPETELAHAVIVGNQVRVAVGSRKIVVRSTGENLGSVQASLGVAELLPDEALDNFIERADRALYSAKRNGRNQVFADGTRVAKLAKTA